MELLAELKETASKPGLKFYHNPNSVSLEIRDKGSLRVQWAYSMSQLLATLDVEALEALESR